jgi:hypothetical protein
MGNDSESKTERRRRVAGGGEEGVTHCGIGLTLVHCHKEAMVSASDLFN